MSTPVAALSNHIRELALAHHRNPNEIQWIAVSKNQSLARMLTVIEQGQYQFGENYLQEALLKINALNHKNLIWHFIGPVQANKTRAIAQHFSWVHSIDRKKIAQRLHDQRPDTLAPLNVCIEINLGQEHNKSGIHPENLTALVDFIQNLPRLRLRGLMALPPLTDDKEAQHHYFRQIRTLFEGLQTLGYPLDTLSMGTSHDYPAAIAEGATLLRIGTTLFGKRT